MYVPLTETVPAHHYTALCRGLGAYLGNADSKISDNDVLRPPGTLNHKTRASGGESTKAEWLIRPPGVRHDKHALAHQLGIVLDETTETPGPAAATAAAEPVDVANYPLVQAALDHNTGDRSADTMRVVGACYDAGLTLAQTRYIVSSRTDLRDRLGERRDDDVLTCWLKAADKRQKTTFTDNNIPPGAPKQVVDGAQLLDNIKHFLARFIVYPTHARARRTRPVDRPHLAHGLLGIHTAHGVPIPRARVREIPRPRGHRTIGAAPGARRQHHIGVPVPQSRRPGR